MSKTVTITATKPQQDFLNLTCKYPALVGGFGSGKTEIMINQAVIDCSMSSSALIGLYEPTYDLVRLILAPRLCEKLYDFGVAYKYNKSENIIYCSNGQFGDFVLRTLDNPERIVGYETFRAGVDEIDTLPKEKAEEAWNKVIARNRQRPEGVKEINRVCAYSTPESFSFLYDRWVKNANEHYQLVKAPTLSNPFLPDDYIQGLKDTYPSELISAYLHGEFVNLTSGTVYNSYDRKAHDSKEVVKPGEPVFVGMDFNIRNMSATIYVKRDKVWHVVDEISDEHNTVSVCDILHDRYSKNKVYVYPDASGGSDQSCAAQSDIEIIRGKPYGFECRIKGEIRGQSKGKNPRIRDRVNSMNAALEQGLVKVNSEKCPRTVECLEQQAYDKSGLPDKSTGVDHQNDATTYVIAYELPIRKPVSQIDASFVI